MAELLSCVQAFDTAKPEFLPAVPLGWESPAQPASPRLPAHSLDPPPREASHPASLKDSQYDM